MLKSRKLSHNQSKQATETDLWIARMLLTADKHTSGIKTYQRPQGKDRSEPRCREYQQRNENF